MRGSLEAGGEQDHVLPVHGPVQALGKQRAQDVVGDGARVARSALGTLAAAAWSRAKARSMASPVRRSSPSV
ncbi:hypothetical protein STANM309S_05485 [Streptomyces tanashiensis]